MNESKIEELIGKFMDGATSNAEEQMLYAYFAGTDIAPELERYKAMFGWFAGGMAGPLPQQAKRRPAMRRVLRWTGVAASALLLLGAGICYHGHSERQKLYATYEGSYIIRNGKKITDLKVILPELKRVEEATMAQEAQRKKIARMSPEEIFRMMETKNRNSDNDPII